MEPPTRPEHPVHAPPDRALLFTLVLLFRVIVDAEDVRSWPTTAELVMLAEEFADTSWYTVHELPIDAVPFPLVRSATITLPWIWLPLLQTQLPCSTYTL